MVVCRVCGCRQGLIMDGRKVTFHRFPQHETRRQQWIDFVNKTSWKPNWNTKSSFICSIHFTKDSFEAFSNVRVRLKPNAIPTKVFDVQVKRQTTRDNNDDSTDDVLSSSTDEDPLKIEVPSASTCQVSTFCSTSPTFTVIPQEHYLEQRIQLLSEDFSSSVMDKDPLEIEVPASTCQLTTLNNSTVNNKFSSTSPKSTVTPQERYLERRVQLLFENLSLKRQKIRTLQKIVYKQKKTISTLRTKLAKFKSLKLLSSKNSVQDNEDDFLRLFQKGT